MVENHGVPGYSTVEHIVQTAFDFRSKRPKCAIFYVGWNDLRNSNIKGLRADYSNFHLLTQPGNLAIDAIVDIVDQAAIPVHIDDQQSRRAPN